MDLTSTFVVVLTPAGRGAVAVVLVAGPNAVTTVDRYFRPASGRPLSDAPIGRIRFGRWGGVDGEEVVACRRAIDRVEVHCHGGDAAVRSAVARLVAAGCRETGWQDWLRMTEADPIRAAAHIALAEAPTARTAGILLDQFHGALGRAVCTTAAAIAGADWFAAADVLDRVLAFSEVGEHLTRPWQVVLTGAPNVGKSSLINALSGYERAIVSHVPGTTRDVVTTITSIDGWPIQLLDTAGLRSADDELEAAGVALAGAATARADLVVVVEDATRGHPPAAEVESQLPASGRFLRVLNKIDLLQPTQSQPNATNTVWTSALAGEGISELLAAIGRVLVPVVPPAGAAVPFTAEQVAALATARTAVARRDAAAATKALRALLAE